MLRTLFTIILVGLLPVVAGCGGGAGEASTTNRELIFSVTPPSGTESFEGSSYKYEMEILADAGGVAGESLYGPAEAVSYNVDNNQYSARIDNILDGTYFLRFTFVRATEDGGESLVLAGITKEVGVSGASSEVDLTSDDWSTNSFDNDEDGLCNLSEIIAGTDPANEDTDGDGVLDSIDAFPLSVSASYDFDGDGVADDVDTDMDNDGLSNTDEAAVDSNPLDSDSDDDGMLDGSDNCAINSNANQLDTDSDGAGNVCDADDDGDGLSDTVEIALGTNSLVADTDGDGVVDGSDAYPKDAAESLDTDGDGIGDNADTDDDNDGVLDSVEIAQGSNPKDSDTDSDNIADGIDNCVTVVNPGQSNNDRDSLGDDCDDDDDNDGLTDVEEEGIGADGFITNKLVADSDGDGFTDNLDNCPTTYNVDQTADADGDGFGDACDCNDADPAINQLTTDLPDPQVLDSNCDGIDGNKYEAVFVSTDGTAAAEDTDTGNPTNDINAALEYAQEQGIDVFFETGDYNIAEIELQDGVSLFGGFSASFLERDMTGDVYPTRLINNQSNDDASALTIDSMTSDITLGGFVIENDSTDENQSAIYVKNSYVVLQSNKFVGNEAVNDETLLKVEDATVSVQGNQFYGNSRAQTVGFSAENSSGFVTSNLFAMGDTEHTEAVLLNSSNLVLTNNTIDGGAHETGVAYGLRFTNSKPTIVNNIFITLNDTNQTSIYCEGTQPEDEIVLENNLFLRYSSSGLRFPAYIACDGSNLDTNTELEASVELSADDNLVSTVTDSSNLADVLDVADYYKIVSGSATADALTPLNAGQDADDADMGAVTYDIFGVTKSADSYDIGAHEFE